MAFDSLFIGVSGLQAYQNQIDVNTNLAMNGDGFFILRKPNGNGSPVYTRNGDFSLNSNGLLYDGSSGLAVQGYLADKNGTISQTGTPGDITIPLGLQSQAVGTGLRSEEHTSELQSRGHLVCRLLLEKKKTHKRRIDAMPQRQRPQT